MKKKVLITGMTCEHCVRRVKETLSQVEGVSNVEVSLKDNHAIVEAHSAIADEVLKAAVEEVEYQVSRIERV